jgi:hypothetical protein
MLKILSVLTPCDRFPVLGHMEAFPNQNVTHAWEGDHYVRIPIVAAGERVYLLMTPREYSEARMRANKLNNLVDCPRPKGWLGRYLWPVLRSSSYHRVNFRLPADPVPIQPVQRKPRP